MQELRDGTIIPSELMAVDTGGGSFGSSAFNNTALRVGEVVEILYPDNERNLSKKFIEYRVAVQQRDGEGGAVLTIYNNCMLLNGFGGIADKSRFTLRADPRTEREGDGQGQGSKVLLLCVNGETNQAVILGGIRDENDQDHDREADGHNGLWEFNGISLAIDKQGQLKLQFRGATQADGKLDSSHGADDSHGPTTLELKQNGNLEIYTKDEAQAIRLDHENKKTDFHFDQEWKVKVNGKVGEDYGAAWECSVGSTITHSARGSIDLKSQTGSITLSCLGQSFIKSAGLRVGLATDAFMKGTTYRVAESVMNSQLIGYLLALQGSLQVASASINAACVPMKIPIAGPIVASFLLQPAGVALQLASQSAMLMMQAITSFEAGAPTYISLLNWGD